MPLGSSILMLRIHHFSLLCLSLVLSSRVWSPLIVSNICQRKSAGLIQHLLKCSKTGNVGLLVLDDSVDRMCSYILVLSGGVWFPPHIGICIWDRWLNIPCCLWGSICNIQSFPEFFKKGAVHGFTFVQVLAILAIFASTRDAIGVPQFWNLFFLLLRWIDQSRWHHTYLSGFFVSWKDTKVLHLWSYPVFCLGQ